MALDTRLIGQALGLGRPADVAGAIEPAIQKGEKIFAEQRARREREQVRAREEQVRQENNTAKATSLLSTIDESGVAANLRPYVMKNAQIIRNKAIEKIKAAETPAEKIAITMEANQEIGKLAAKNADFNKYLANFDGLKGEDVSAINKKDIGIQIGKVLDGNFKITEDGKFDFEDGRGAVDFNSVISTNYINKRSDTYLKLMDKANKIGMEAGIKGLGQEAYGTLLEQGIASVEMSDLDALSVAIDHMKMDEIFIDGIDTKLLVESLKEDFEDDNTINNKGNAEKMAKLKQGILDSVKKAGLSSKSSYSTLKAEYDKKVSIDNAGKIKPSYTDASEMLQSVYDKLPTSLSATTIQQEKEKAIIKANIDLTEEEKEEEIKKINASSKALGAGAIANIVKNEPIFGDAEIEDPSAAKEAIIKGLMEDKDFNYSKQEAENYYNKKYGNALIIINGQPINDINGILSAYNRKLPAARKLTNLEMKKIIEGINIGTGSTPATFSAKELINKYSQNQ